MVRNVYLLVVFSLAVPRSLAFAAAPKVDYVFPTGARVGTSVEATVSGTFDAWPVQVWVNRDGVKIEPAEEKGKLKVTVAADAVPGVYWYRLYDAEGSAALRPFVVGTLGEVTETEPNDDYRKAQQLDSSQVTISGRLARNGDVDGFAVELKQGQTLVASMQANGLLGSPMDAVLQIVSGDGFVLESNDDYHGNDPQIVFTAPRDGRYVVRTFAFPSTPDSSIRFSGGNSYVYRLTLTTGGFVDHAMPLAVPRDTRGEVWLFGWNLPEETTALPVPDAAAEDLGPALAAPESAELWHAQWANTLEVELDSHPSLIETASAEGAVQTIAIPSTVTGRIAAAREVDVYSFAAAKDQKLVFRIESNQLGYPLDAVLRVTGEAGKPLAEGDDEGGGRGRRRRRRASPAGRDVSLAFTAPADGQYRIEVRDLYGHGGFRYVYRLAAETPEPDYALALAAERFVVSPGKALEIAVTVARENGFSGEVDVTVAGLPEGVTAAPAKSLGKGESAGTVKLQLTSTAGPWSGPIAITGSVAGEAALGRAATAAIDGLSDRTAVVWLTVVKP